jgi:hypothetical protein
MASTYVNDLRLNEMATGDGSGTWGTTTNTNLELIAEAFSYGTEVITTNADTHTTTIADGATDPGRSLYLKYTGTLDSACTITIGPNTVSKVWIIENGTSGSQNIIISQGSGANITIPAGDTKVVYSDGAGAGAAFVDAFASLSVVDLKVQDDLTVYTGSNRRNHQWFRYYFRHRQHRQFRLYRCSMAKGLVRHFNSRNTYSWFRKCYR